VDAVSSSFFRFFDAKPALGRFFVASEDSTPVGAAVAVLGYAFWQNDLGGRDVLGTTLRVGNTTYTIVGVAAKGFVGVSAGTPPAVYVPITTFAGSQRDRYGARYFQDYSWSWTQMLVRRKPGVSLAAANADLTTAHARSWNVERAERATLPPADIARPRAVASALRETAGPDPDLESRTLLWVSGVAAIVLLIACANVANLFLARTLRRRREIALRLALGVSRARLAAQSLTESIVLSLLGCVVGIAVAQWGGVTLRRLFIGETSSLDVVGDPRTLGVALGAALLAGLITGLVPVMFSGRRDLAGTLKMGAREGTYHRSPARSALLITQGALSMALLVGAGLFVKSVQHVRDLRMGYDAEQVLIVRRNLRGAAMSDSEQVQLGRRLLEAAQSVPGVEHAAWVSSIPFWTTMSASLFVAGIDSVSRLGEFSYQQATADYFPTMGTRILRGRAFTKDDRATSAPIAVVSESMAKVLWPGADALGRCMRIGSDTMPCTTVVGIAEDAEWNTLTDETRYRYYVPIEQFRPAGGSAVVMRMRDDPAVAAERVRKALQAVMPGETYVTTRPMREVVDSERRSWKVGATMFIALGGLALVVAAVGLYGVVAYNVAQRMQELGVRVALGAQAPDIVRLVVGQGVRFAVAGVTLGTLLALIAARWLQPLLFQQSAKDITVFGVVGGVLITVAILASSIPARRAVRVDPNTVLRAD
jgi:putative ABC transport system permease protein